MLKIILNNFAKKLIFTLYFLAFFIPDHSFSRALDIDLDDAQFYFLIDAQTKEILLSKNADVQIAPSSMTKVMTAYVIFDQIKKGNLKLTNQCLVGKDAWRKSGSSMFLNYGDVVTIDQLLQGLLAVSGNDAAVALAEASGNGFDNFIDLMNLKAREIGLRNSHFKNPHGLNQNGHYMTLRDLATLTIRIYNDFPEYRKYLSIEEFTYGNITQRNRHPLIKADYDGIKGGKTGHTNKGGYGALGIVKRDNRVLVGVVNKVRTPKMRAKMIQGIMDYGFHKYKKLELFKKDQVVVDLKTWLGSDSRVGAMIDQDITMTVPRDKELDFVDVKVKYKGPIYAPIKKGDKIAKLIVKVKGYKTAEYPLFAKENVDKVSFLGRMRYILRYRLKSYLRRLLY